MNPIIILFAIIGIIYLTNLLYNGLQLPEGGDFENENCQ